MGKNRLEAFSDGVIAVIITIMVLEMKAPHGESFAALIPVIPIFLNYVLSFIYVAIYWNNHHHLMHVTQKVTGGVLWANLHLLFWLSLFPLLRGWAKIISPVTPPQYMAWCYLWPRLPILFLNKCYCQRRFGITFKKVLGRDRKGKASVILYATGIAASFWVHWIAQGIYVLVALMWLIPDRRIERASNH
jgi:uncharacterized membrane protein